MCVFVCSFYSFLLNCFLAAEVSLFSVHKSSYFHLSAPGVDETIPLLDNHISPSRLPRQGEEDAPIPSPFPLPPHTPCTPLGVCVSIALLGFSICTIIPEVRHCNRRGGLHQTKWFVSGGLLTCDHKLIQPEVQLIGKSVV